MIDFEFADFMLLPAIHEALDAAGIDGMPEDRDRREPSPRG